MFTEVTKRIVTALFWLAYVIRFEWQIENDPVILKISLNILELKFPKYSSSCQWWQWQRKQSVPLLWYIYVGGDVTGLTLVAAFCWSSNQLFNWLIRRPVSAAKALNIALVGWRQPECPFSHVSNTSSCQRSFSLGESLSENTKSAHRMNDFTYTTLVLISGTERPE